MVRKEGQASFATRKMMTHADIEEVLTGREEWPVIGGMSLSPEKKRLMIWKMKGLKKHWDCLAKAKAAREVLGIGSIMVGSCLVTSGDYRSQYGFMFNPPYELHAWLSLPDTDGMIVDAALPGVIAKGLSTNDDVGPALINRDPVMLAGHPPDWVQYTAVEELDENAGQDCLQVYLLSPVSGFCLAKKGGA